MSARNLNPRYSAHKRANAETSTRERHTSAALAVKPEPELEHTPLFDRSPYHDDAFSSEPEPTINRSPTYRKRRLCEDVSLATKETNKRKKSEMSDDLKMLHHAARFIPRIFGPFVNITSTFLSGVRLDYQLERAPDLFSRLSEDEQKLLNLYRKILTVIPGLEAQVRYTVENRSSRLVDLATYIETTGDKGRSDDCSSLRNNALDYIPRIKDVPSIERKAKKEQRGFYHLMTARLLCPRQLRDQFDTDMEGFCRRVQNGTLAITHNDLPSFLYPEDEYNADALDEHLLRGPFLLSCFRHLFTGLRTASKATPGRAPGKKCLADLNDMTEVFPGTIAYVAVLCRYVLNGKESWSVQDGSFHADTFFRNIMDLFDDQEWAEETLEWWNKQVFGDDPYPQDDTLSQPHDSGVTRLAEQRAARRAAAAAQSESD